MTNQEILEQLKEILHVLKPKTDLSAVEMNTALVTDLGIDSLSLMLLSLAVEDHFKIEFESAVSFLTVGEVVDYVAGKLTA